MTEVAGKQRLTGKPCAQGNRFFVVHVKLSMAYIRIEPERTCPRQPKHEPFSKRCNSEQELLGVKVPGQELHSLVIYLGGADMIHLPKGRSMF